MTRGRPSRSRIGSLLLLLGLGLLAALSFQFWRAGQLAQQVRDGEIERAALVAERLLQKAVQSRAVFEALPPERRFRVGADGVAVDATVGWLQPLAADADTDLVVQNRLDRAAEAEFVARDQGAAAREYDALLAGPLAANQRLLVLSSAAWQSLRTGADQRCQSLRADLTARLDTLQPADLARPSVATAVAAAFRLSIDGAPAWAGRLAPFLPPTVFAGLPAAETLAPEHARIAARRDLLRAADACWHRLAPTADAGLVAATPERVLWWQPGDGAQHDAAWLSPREWFAAVRDAGTSGALTEWPWLIEPVFASTEHSFAGVPGLRALAPTSAAAFAERRWVLPLLTLTLLLALVLTFAQQVRASRREAEAVRAQAEFVTTVTHELKTPLASIRLLGEMLVEGRAAGRETEYYRMLAGEAGRLSMLIENVLDLGRLERGERAYDRRRVVVDEVVDDTLALFAPIAEGAGIAVHRTVRCGSDTAVHLDRGAFVQALVSVLDNARKYGGAPGPIEVDARCSGDRVTIAVRDHGSGVPAAERERIFDRFVRGSAHRHGSTPGLGIGLHLARTIARQLGGDLDCTAPAAGAGAVFTFHFPVDATP